MEQTRISFEHAEELLQTAAQHGIASWRQTALMKEMGVHLALSISLEEMVKRSFGGYMKLTLTERRNAVKELESTHSVREIAEILGVGKSQVDRDIQVAKAIVPNGTPESSEQPQQPKPVPNGTPVDTSPLTKKIDALTKEVKTHKDAAKKEQTEHKRETTRLNKQIAEYQLKVAEAEKKAKENLTDQERNLAKKEAEAWAQEQGQKIMAGLSFLVVGHVTSALQEATKSMRTLNEQGEISDEQYQKIEEVHAAFVEEMNVANMSRRGL